mgnify:CR=1 FL=1
MKKYLAFDVGGTSVKYAVVNEEGEVSSSNKFKTPDTLEKMYQEIARVEIEKVMEETRIMLKGLAPENYEIRKLSNKLSKLTLERVIIINPEIVKYNKQVLKYVILHEFCHLKYKTHSKGFYKMMQKYMPEYESYEYIEQVA